MQTNEVDRAIRATLNDEPWFSILAMADRYEEEGKDVHAKVLRWMAEWRRFPRTDVGINWDGKPRVTFYWLPKRIDSNSRDVSQVLIPDTMESRSFWRDVKCGGSTHAYPYYPGAVYYTKPPTKGYDTAREAIIALVGYLVRQERFLHLQ